MKWRFAFLLLVFLLSACNPSAAPTTPQPGSTPGTPAPQVTSLPTPVSKVTSVPDVKAAVEQFLAAWQVDDHTKMYAMLDDASRASIDPEAFAALYNAMAKSMTLQSLDFNVYAAETTPATSKAAFQVIYHTALFKDLERQNEMSLTLENGQWRVKWDDGLPLPELRGGNRLTLDLSVPERGQIVDRNNELLAGNTDAVAFSLVPGNLVSTQENLLLDTLAYLTGQMQGNIRQSYQNVGPDWYVGVGETSQETLETRAGTVNNLGGIQQWPYGPTRFYPWGGVGPHVTGYVQYLPAENLDRFLRQGYRQDERIGASGLEAWGQEILAGTRGATLNVANPNGQIISRLAQVEQAGGKTIVTTLDMKLQRGAQTAIREFTGAIVVLERDTGRVLAMVSSPEFNPNLFDANNYNSQMGMLSKMLNNPESPLVNRASGDQASGYPLGSVFKIITMAAALESGVFTPESEYDCQYIYNGIIGRPYFDWTRAKEKPPSGILTLPEGLMRSCNPWFYHIGLTLYNTPGHEKDIANMARAFGLGSKTGIELDEIAGVVPEPDSNEASVEQAIGQDKLLVTPLQVASFVAAVGNGGTLYTPQVVEKIIAADGTESDVFQPQARGTLPVKKENLEVIQQAMRAVVDHERGTAYDVMGAFRIPVYGKTGTAQSCDSCDPFAWFAAYTEMPDSPLPDISVAVICEHTGEGSEIAAPIARRVIEIYYLGKLLNLYPWEVDFNVTRTETPTPMPGEEDTESTPEP